MARDPIVVKVDPEIADMIPRFLENRKRDAIQVREVLAAGDLEAARRLGHTLKGVGGGYGFPLVSELGGLIEAAAEAGDAAAAQDAAERLADYLDRVTYVADS